MNHSVATLIKRIEALKQKTETMVPQSQYLKLKERNKQLRKEIAHLKREIEFMIETNINRK